MHYFEFAVTPFIDWKEILTIFVKAESSHDAIKYLLKVTDEDNIDYPFADFKFRTFVPECCLPNDAVIYEVK